MRETTDMDIYTYARACAIAHTRDFTVRHRGVLAGEIDALTDTIHDALKTLVEEQQVKSYSPECFSPQHIIDMLEKERTICGKIAADEAKDMAAKIVKTEGPKAAVQLMALGQIISGEIIERKKKAEQYRKSFGL